MNEPSPMKPDFHHLQISLRLPHWVVAEVDALAATEYSNRASILRRLIACSVRNAPQLTTYPVISKNSKRDHPHPTESHPEPTPFLHHRSHDPA